MTGRAEGFVLRQGWPGVRQLWLLTTGAEHYFEKLGFLAASRALAPPEIRQTTEFTSLCPDSAVLMSKSLQP
ncbi:MAG: hypothetical protein L0Y45_06000 [Woeseiaceae bacterium]|nr:hypothetical protein [Woeseiaceae bacterium]